jgi:hypothetical protein
MPYKNINKVSLYAEISYKANSHNIDESRLSFIPMRRLDLSMLDLQE